MFAGNGLPLGSEEAIDEHAGGGAGRVGQVIVDDEELPKKHNGEDACITVRFREAGGWVVDLPWDGGA